MAKGWSYQSIAAWKHADPAQLALSKDQHWLYITTNGEATAFGASLMALNMKSGRQQTLIYGLNRLDAMAMAPDGTLWLGENFAHGLIWRVTKPDVLPEEQLVDRVHQSSENPAISSLRIAGVFAHASMVFSANGRDIYLADAMEGGGLYRFRIGRQQLQVWRDADHWQAIHHPDEARIEAKQLEARAFHNIRGLTRMDDGRILLAESGSGTIFALNDSEKPTLETWLSNSGVQHPSSIAWDSKRHWLWLTDQGKHAWLWAWDGRDLLEVSHHKSGIFSGVHSSHGRVFVNIRRTRGSAPEAVIELQERVANDD
ncbi:MAG: hypothetical protein Q9M09_03970 [Mariprofundaceae bacterium]|nr:hypothetical protein [Mariprofundaceae bacterium]